MANLGEVTEAINTEFVTLEVGANKYILMQDVRFNIERPELRKVHSGAGVIYFFGAGDNTLEFTLTASGPELISLNTLTQRDANGDLTSTTFLVKGKDVSGATTTATLAGKLTKMEIIRNPGLGELQVKCRIRITGDTVTVA